MEESFWFSMQPYLLVRMLKPSFIFCHSDRLPKARWRVIPTKNQQHFRLLFIERVGKLMQLTYQILMKREKEGVCVCARES